MGIENNEVVIATTWNEELIEEIKEFIDNTINLEFKQLFVYVPSIVNNKWTIIMAPDGSKKGWRTADKGKILRDLFIGKLKSFSHEDGSNPFDWIEVGYGELGQKVLRGNCVNRYTNDEYYEGY